MEGDDGGDGGRGPPSVERSRLKTAAPASMTASLNAVEGARAPSRAADVFTLDDDDHDDLPGQASFHFPSFPPYPHDHF